MYPSYTLVFEDKCKFEERAVDYKLWNYAALLQLPLEGYGQPTNFFPPNMSALIYAKNNSTHFAYEHLNYKEEYLNLLRIKNGTHQIEFQGMTKGQISKPKQNEEKCGQKLNLLLLVISEEEKTVVWGCANCLKSDQHEEKLILLLSPELNRSVITVRFLAEANNWAFLQIQDVSSIDKLTIAGLYTHYIQNSSSIVQLINFPVIRFVKKVTIYYFGCLSLIILFLLFLLFELSKQSFLFR